MMFRRRREKRTDYRQRLALLRSGKPRAVVRRTLRGFHVQIAGYDAGGDRMVAEVDSGKLKRYGWKGHGGNLPSAYLTGLLAGLEAKKKNISSAVADLGMHVSVRGSSLYACLLGLRDAGVEINIGEEALPPMERVSGKHIAAHAERLKQDAGKYKKQFSGCLERGLEPERMPEHFEEVRKKIIEEMKKKEIVQEAG